MTELKIMFDIPILWIDNRIKEHKTDIGIKFGRHNAKIRFFLAIYPILTSATLLKFSTLQILRLQLYNTSICVSISYITYNYCTSKPSNFTITTIINKSKTNFYLFIFSTIWRRAAKIPFHKPFYYYLNHLRLIKHTFPSLHVNKTYQYVDIPYFSIFQ